MEEFNLIEKVKKNHNIILYIIIIVLIVNVLLSVINLIFNIKFYQGILEINDFFNQNKESFVKLNNILNYVCKDFDIC